MAVDKHHVIMERDHDFKRVKVCRLFILQEGALSDPDGRPEEQGGSALPGEDKAARQLAETRTGACSASRRGLRVQRPEGLSQDGYPRQ